MKRRIAVFALALLPVLQGCPSQPSYVPLIRAVGESMREDATSIKNFQLADDLVKATNACADGATAYTTPAKVYTACSALIMDLPQVAPSGPNDRYGMDVDVAISTLQGILLKVDPTASTPIRPGVNLTIYVRPGTPTTARQYRAKINKIRKLRAEIWPDVAPPTK